MILESALGLNPTTHGNSFLRFDFLACKMEIRDSDRKFQKEATELGMSSFSSVTQLCPTLCNPMDCSTPGFPVHHQFPKLAQTHVHQVSDAIQPSHSLLSPSPPAFNLSQHQGLFQGVSSSYHVAKGYEFQLQHQSFQ